MGWPDEFSFSSDANVELIKELAFKAAMIELFVIIYSVVISIKILLFLIMNYMKRKQVALHKRRQDFQDFSAFNTDHIEKTIVKELGNGKEEELYWCDVSIAEDDLVGVIMIIVFSTIGICALILISGLTTGNTPMIIAVGINVGLCIPVLVALDFVASISAMCSGRYYEAVYILSSSGARIIPTSACMAKPIFTPYDDMPICEISDTKVYFTFRNMKPNSPLNEANYNKMAKRGFENIYNTERPASIINARIASQPVNVLSLDNFVNFRNSQNTNYSQVSQNLDLTDSQEHSHTQIQIQNQNQSFPPQHQIQNQNQNQNVPRNMPPPQFHPAVPVERINTVFLQTTNRLLGFVKLPSSATILDLRSTVESDEIPVPKEYTVLYNSVPITKKQEGKVLVEECMATVEGKNVIFLLSSSDSNVVIDL